VDQLVLFTLLGLGTGALIAGIGLGVVLTYRGSGVINVATGAEAMAAGYAFYSLRTVTGTPLALLGHWRSRSRSASRSSCWRSGRCAPRRRWRGSSPRWASC
jgi:hypothetical protein